MARWSVLDAITGVRRGGPVRRDPGPWLAVLLVAALAALVGIFALAAASWWQAAAALVIAAAAGVIAVRASALTRAEGWQARRELLGVLRALDIGPDGAFLLNRDSRLMYEVTVKSARVLPPGPRIQVIRVAEFTEDNLLNLAGGGPAHLTGRSFAVVPWDAGVQLTVRDATFGPGEEAAKLAYRQWYPDERTAAGMVRREWRSRRAGSRFASPGVVRELAARLASAQLITPGTAS